MATIAVIGAGVTGLWQAFRLAQDGHAVRLFERSAEPFEQAASRLAGAMLAPFCEGEAAEPWIIEEGQQAVALWSEVFAGTVQRGSLVVALPRDLPELRRFARMTDGHRRVGVEEIQELEPALTDRFGQALFYPQEGHVEPGLALDALVRRTRETGAEFVFGRDWTAVDVRDMRADHIVDCRGMGARAELPELRGVRGEMLVVETREVSLSRPVRLLHPRFPLYIVPWEGNRFMIGATVIESGEKGPVTVRSALDLLGAAYALNPAFGEARILHFGADVRPAFPDNAPHIVLRGNRIHVNGLYRHGFLLAPVLAGLVARYIREGTVRGDVFVDDHSEWRADAIAGAHPG